MLPARRRCCILGCLGRLFHRHSWLLRVELWLRSQLRLRSPELRLRRLSRRRSFPTKDQPKQNDSCPPGQGSFFCCAVGSLRPKVAAGNNRSGSDTIKAGSTIWSPAMRNLRRSFALAAIVVFAVRRARRRPVRPTSRPVSASSRTSSSRSSAESASARWSATKGQRRRRQRRLRFADRPDPVDGRRRKPGPRPAAARRRFGRSRPA